ncbi:MAG TPA: type II toxin-antitoxin system VapC family toxin [Candidatus Polarisedimenticolaceae bacterium]|nr:type II toxin-antitoxin system VapC family toxin [Candidatus Polarisedimenticolaceae bacterium]
MKLLLDAHAVLWWMADDRRLGADARAGISDACSVVLVSAATVWEIEIKRRLGRLEMGDADLTEQLVAEGFAELPISSRHARRAAHLPPHHDDPFDRMIVAQALLEGLTCVSRDAALSAYGVPILW